MSAPDDRMGIYFTVIAGAVVAVLGCGALAGLYFLAKFLRSLLGQG